MMKLLDDYLALRRVAGYKLEGTENRLRRFVRFAVARGDEHVRIDTAVEWAGTAQSPYDRHVRLCDIAIFARYLRAENDRHEVPNPAVFAAQRHKRLPYIYSDEEIRRIIEVARQRHRQPGDCLGDTYATFFGLVASTGLRLREAVRLDIKDLTDSSILIRNTKFKKSRLVPLHASTLTELGRYLSKWRATATPDDPMFVSSVGKRVDHNGVHRVFREVTAELGMRVTPVEAHRMPGPRIHDLRHTFAVRALESSPTGRDAINKHMLAVSTYLGHASVADTYWYFHATPQLTSDIADACEAWLVGGAR